MPDVESGGNREGKLVRELEKEGVKWQPQVERRWLADLLGDEKAVAPLLKFLKTTGTGGREGAREGELEWERKNAQEGESLLGKTQEGKPKSGNHLERQDRAKMEDKRGIEPGEIMYCKDIQGLS